MDRRERQTLPSRDSRNAYRVVFESLLDPIVLLDDEHSIVDMNAAAVRLALSGDATRSARVAACSAVGHRSKPFGSDVTRVFPWLAGVLPGARDSETAAAAAECAVVIDGRERFFEVQYLRAAVSGDRPTSAVLSLREVTERRIAEDALRQREAAMRSILRAAPTGIGQILDGALLHVNDRICEMTGYSPDELVGRQVGMLYGSDEGHDRVDREQRREIRERGYASMETRWLHKDGREIDVLLNLTAVNPAETASAVTFTALDITERKRFEKELLLAREEAEAASQAKSRFLSTVSHEIRTPLNAIVGMADALAGTPLSQRQQYYLQVCRTAGEDLLTIVNNVLDISKIEAGQVEFEAIAFDLIEEIERVSDILAFRAHDKGLELSTIVHPGTETRLLGDPHRLRQILLNLVGNAVKFTERGRVAVEVWPAETHPDDSGDGSPDSLALTFAVSDTGIGIPGDKLESIFESFTQADSSTTRKFGGTGLGLAISQRLVELMAGSIEVESVPGEGSRFLFTVRFEHGSASVSATGARHPGGSSRSAAVSASQRFAPARVLLVEDSASNQRVIHAFFSDSPIRVEVATDGSSAVERFKSGNYDLVLMDIEMPEMDGFAAVRAIRRWERRRGHAATPIVAITAHALAGLADRCLAAGFNAYLAKPIKKAEFLAAVSSYLEPDPLGPSSKAETSLPERTPRGAATRSDEPIEPSFDPCLAPLVPGFLRAVRKDLDAVARHLERGEFDRIRTLGHRMKGDGGTYGFENLAALGRRIQSAAERADGDEVSDILVELASSLDRIDVTRSRHAGDGASCQETG